MDQTHFHLVQPYTHYVGELSILRKAETSYTFTLKPIRIFDLMERYTTTGMIPF